MLYRSLGYHCCLPPRCSLVCNVWCSVRSYRASAVRPTVHLWWEHQHRISSMCFWQHRVLIATKQKENEGDDEPRVSLSCFFQALNHKLGDILYVYPSWILKAGRGESSSITGPEDDYCGKALLDLSCCQWSVITLLNMSICCGMSLLFYSLSLNEGMGFFLKTQRCTECPDPSMTGREIHFRCWLGSLLLWEQGKQREMYNEQQGSYGNP